MASFVGRPPCCAFHLFFVHRIWPACGDVVRVIKVTVGDAIMSEPMDIAHPQPSQLMPLSIPPRRASFSGDETQPSSAHQHTDTGTEPTSSVSPRTPSPILGHAPALDNVPGAISGHLTFPQVGLGLGTMEQEMQMLMELDETADMDAKTGTGLDTQSSEWADLASLLTSYGYSMGPDDGVAAWQPPTSLPEEASAREQVLATCLLHLLKRMRQQEDSREHLKHLLRVTRLASLSLFSSLRISYSHMLQAERDIKARLEVELSGSKSQSKMLSDMISRASLHSHDEKATSATTRYSMPSLDDEEEARRAPTSPTNMERTKLLADKRYLRQRVKDAEAQVARLESELKTLRPLLLRANHEDDMSDVLTPSRHGTRTPLAKPRRREATMGDATAEHLLLATRMLRTLRHASRPSSTADVSPMKHDVMPTTPHRQHATAKIPSQSSYESYPHTPTSLHRTDDMHSSPYAPMSARSVPSSSHYSSGLDDLLHAAQSLGPMSYSHSHAPSSRYADTNTSPTRASPWARVPTSLTPGAVSQAYGSPKRRRMGSGSSTMDDAPLPSALDVLAHHAAIEHPSSPTHVHSHAPAYASSHHRRTHSGSYAAPTSGTWSPVPVPRAPASASKPRPSSGGSQHSPEKRLPYVRWSAEEDTKLRRAIKEHGQRWEHVARAVGTRSYHQCRQRYLLMRRKEAAANGLASPSKNNRTVPRQTTEKSHTQEEESSGGSSEQETQSLRASEPLLEMATSTRQVTSPTKEHETPPLSVPTHASSPLSRTALSPAPPVLQS